MKTMDKRFEYRGINFNIKIELRVKAERTPNGKVWHNLMINNTENWGNYGYKKDLVEDKNLHSAIDEMISNAKDWVDKRNPIDPIVEKLIKLGFE